MEGSSSAEKRLVRAESTPARLVAEFSAADVDHPAAARCHDVALDASGQDVYSELRGRLAGSFGCPVAGLEVCSEDEGKLELCAMLRCCIGTFGWDVVGTRGRLPGTVRFSFSLSAVGR